MSNMRWRLKMEIAISDDSSEERNMGNSVFSQVTDEYGEGGSWGTKVPVLAVDQSIPLVNVASIKGLLIVTSSDDPTLAPVPLDLKLNAIGATPIPLVPYTNAKECYFLLQTTGLTALFVSNPSATTIMKMKLFAVGD